MARSHGTFSGAGELAEHIHLRPCAMQLRRRRCGSAGVDGLTARPLQLLVLRLRRVEALVVQRLQHARKVCRALQGKDGKQISACVSKVCLPGLLGAPWCVGKASI